MGTQKTRLENAERAAKHLPADDAFREYGARDWAGTLSEILGKEVPVVGSARGLRAAQAAMQALSVSDLRGVLTWLENSPHERQGKDSR
jgi:hypothetical protein